MKDLENKLLDVITQKQVYKTSFAELIAGFEKKLHDFDFINKSFALEKYFSGKIGQVGVTKRLLENGLIEKTWLRHYKTKKGKTKTDFKGFYIFLHGNIPIYVGISKGVIGRILQHLKGHSHNTSTLAYSIGLEMYLLEKGEKYLGGRKEFDFKSEVGPAKEFLFKQKIAFLPIHNDEEMYLFEIYCAMQLQCWLNKFETH